MLRINLGEVLRAWHLSKDPVRKTQLKWIAKQYIGRKQLSREEREAFDKVMLEEEKEFVILPV